MWDNNSVRAAPLLLYLSSLTFHIDCAPAGQHHHIGRGAGWSWWFYRGSYSAAGRRGAGGGAGGARVGVTYNHCEEEIKCVIWCLMYLSTTFSGATKSWWSTFFVSCFSWQHQGGVLIGCGAGHSISGDGESCLGDQPRHQGDESASFNWPFRRAVWTRHAEKQVSSPVTALKATTPCLKGEKISSSSYFQETTWCTWSEETGKIRKDKLPLFIFRIYLFIFYLPFT